MGNVVLLADGVFNPDVILSDGQFNPDIDVYDGLTFCISHELIDGVRFYTRRANVGILNYAMNFAAFEGKLKMIRILIQKGANDWNVGMYGAAENGNKRLVDYFIKKGADNWDDGLAFAMQCRGDNFPLVKLFIRKGADINLGLYHAAINEKGEYINFIIDMGVDDWNMGLYGAAACGNK